MANNLCLLCLQAFDNDDDNDTTATQNSIQIKIFCELLAPRQSNNHKDLHPYQFGEDEVCQFCPDCYPLVGTVEEIRNQIALLEEQMVVKIREIRATMLESSSSSLRNEREEQLVEIRDKIIRVTGDSDEEDEDLKDDVKDEFEKEDEVKEEFEEEDEIKEEFEEFEEEDEIKEEFEDEDEIKEEVDESEEEEDSVDPLGDLDDYQDDNISDQETDPLRDVDEEDDSPIIPCPQERPRATSSKLTLNNSPPRPSILSRTKRKRKASPPPEKQGRRKQNLTQIVLVQQSYPLPIPHRPPPAKNSRTTKPAPRKSRKSPVISNVHLDDHIYWGKAIDNNPPKTFNCPSCKERFISEIALHAHIYQYHDGIVACRAPSCNAKFRTIVDMEAHWKLAHSVTSAQKLQGPFECRLCGRKFRKTRLAIHMFVQHEDGEKKYSCGKCPKKFCLIENFHRHVNLHRFDATKPFVCDLCDLRFYDAASLEQHGTTHTRKVKRFKCDQCGKTLANRQTLDRHIRSHTREKTEKCPHCEETFFDKITMKRHIAVNHSTTGRLYSCHLCAKAFYLPTDVKYHIERRHEGKRQCKCDMCDETFQQISSLQSHKIKVHGQDRYPCDECSATFSSESGVRHHKKIHRGIKDHICQTCGASFRWKTELVSHMTAHSSERPFLCSHCGKAFKVKCHLAIHIKGVHTPGYVAPTPHKCPHCEKSFRAPFFLKGHIRQVHTGERPFTCDQCGKGFAVKQALNLHLTGAHGIEVERTKKDRVPRSKRDDFQEKDKRDA
ncbi:zinc finger protein 85 isoform X1 [Folsomia candida]|nr:zinc finger protein 85 isoform X1 [Folsomia candida]